MATEGERTLRTVAIAAVSGGFALMLKGDIPFLYGLATVMTGLVVYFFAHRVK